MKILVIGASQGTGAAVVQSALQRGHFVTAFARSPSKLSIQHEHLLRFQGDFHRADSVARAVAGHDAVIVTASAGSLKGFKEQPDYFSRGTRYVIDAMVEQAVKRLIVLSAFGVGDSRRAGNWLLNRVLIPFVLSVPYADHERQERMVMDSDLDWVIARPTRLTNAPAHGHYLADAAIAPVPSSISRADVADFLVRAVSEDTWLRKAVQLGG